MLNLADLEARAARLESRNYVSMRYGRVTGTKDGEAQIQLNGADEHNTNSYQTLQRRVLRDQKIKLPDIGDTALVLESGQGEEQGAYLGAPYRMRRKTPPFRAGDIRRVRRICVSN